MADTQWRPCGLLYFLSMANFSSETSNQSVMERSHVQSPQRPHDQLAVSFKADAPQSETCHCVCVRLLVLWPHDDHVLYFPVLVAGKHQVAHADVRLQSPKCRCNCFTFCLCLKWHDQLNIWWVKYYEKWICFNLMRLFNVLAKALINIMPLCVGFFVILAYFRFF